MAGILVGAVVFASSSSHLNQDLSFVPEYSINESGETYGSGLYASSPEEEPDLIRAYGVDGTIGYVRSTDLIGELPKTPEEALAQQAKERNDREVPLYDIDGKTVIGKFEIDTPEVVEYTEKMK